MAIKKNIEDRLDAVHAKFDASVGVFERIAADLEETAKHAEALSFTAAEEISRHVAVRNAADDAAVRARSQAKKIKEFLK